MLVSVIIPAFNAAGSIERAVASVSAQTVADLEILVIDDGSTDKTAAIISELTLRDARIRLLPSMGNLGVSAARNRGIREARGDWLAVLDADDAFAPDRLERLLDVANQTESDIVTDNIAYYDWHAGRLTGVLAMASRGRCDRIEASTFFENTITGRSRFDFGQLKPVVRRSFLERSLVVYPEGVRHGEDFLFIAHLLLAGASMILFDLPLYVYTERNGSISRASSGMTRTVENCNQMRNDTLELLRHPSVLASRNLVAPLRRRFRAIRWHQSWETVHYAVRERDFLAVGRHAVCDWRIPILLARKILDRVHDRMIIQL